MKRLPYDDTNPPPCSASLPKWCTALVGCDINGNDGCWLLRSLDIFLLSNYYYYKLYTLTIFLSFIPLISLIHSSLLLYCEKPLLFKIGKIMHINLKMTLFFETIHIQGFINLFSINFRPKSLWSLILPNSL